MVSGTPLMAERPSAASREGDAEDWRFTRVQTYPVGGGAISGGLTGQWVASYLAAQVRGWSACTAHYLLGGACPLRSCHLWSHGLAGSLQHIHTYWVRPTTARLSFRLANIPTGWSRVELGTAVRALGCWLAERRR